MRLNIIPSRDTVSREVKAHRSRLPRTRGSLCADRQFCTVGMDLAIFGRMDTPTVTVQFTPPSNFRQDPRPSDAIQDYDRANGLYVFERWLVSDDATMASFSVQTNPGEESPLLSRLEFSDSITTDALTWYLWDRRSVEPTGTPPNMAMAVTTDYLYMVSGTRAPMQAVIDGLTIER